MLRSWDIRHTLGQQSNGYQMQEVKPKSEYWIGAELDKQRAAHLQRTIRISPEIGGTFTAVGRTWLNFASNDYLDFARHPRLKDAAARALEQYGTGATASRLMVGTLPVHDELEQCIARHKGYAAAVLYGSGYMTNAGVIPALLGRNDHAIADRLIHASVIDAIRLSGATLHRFAHNDPDSLDQCLRTIGKGRRLILTESVFSMDGDLAPLVDIGRLANEYDAMLMVDEAHAGGVFGPRGAGCVPALDLAGHVNVCMGTLSKALGGYGGYAACSQPMRAWLINRSRALIYTTAPPPSVAAAALEAFAILDEEPELGKTLLDRTHGFRTRLQAAGLDTLHSASQIIPILVGDNARAMRLAARLRDDGILVGAVRPPTVPAGTARLRLALTLAHSETDIERTYNTLLAACREEGLL